MLTNCFSNTCLTLVVLLTAVTCLTGCDIGPPGGCDVCSTSAVAYGKVTAPDESPVSNATVLAKAYRMQADSLVQASFEVQYKTNSDGMYYVHPHSLRGPFKARIEIKVIPPEESGLAALVDTSGIVEYRADYNGPERDSVRVDMATSSQPLLLLNSSSAFDARGSYVLKVSTRRASG